MCKYSNFLSNRRDLGYTLICQLDHINKIKHCCSYNWILVVFLTIKRLAIKRLRASDLT